MAADVGMICEANRKAIEAAGPSYQKKEELAAVVSFHFTVQERTSSRAYTMTLLR